MFSKHFIVEKVNDLKYPNSVSASSVTKEIFHWLFVPIEPLEYRPSF